MLDYTPKLLMYFFQRATIDWVLKRQQVQLQTMGFCMLSIVKPSRALENTTKCLNVHEHLFSIESNILVACQSSNITKHQMFLSY